MNKSHRSHIKRKPGGFPLARIVYIIFCFSLILIISQGNVFSQDSEYSAPQRNEGPKTVEKPKSVDPQTWDSILSDRAKTQRNQPSATVESRENERAETQPDPSENSELPSHWDTLDHLSPVSRAPTVKIPPAQTGKATAYIMAGDVSSRLSEIFDLYESLTGSSPEQVPTTGEEWTQGIVMQARDLLTKAGYTHIRFNMRAGSADLKTALENPSAGAIVWIGHGDAGEFYDFTGNTVDGIISSEAVKRWALDFLEHKGIYQDPHNFLPDSRMQKAMTRISDRAHFGLNYFYAHVCSVMQEPQVAMDMMTDGGRYEGYVGVKFAYVNALTPPFSNIAHNEIPSVHDIIVVPEVTGTLPYDATQRIRDEGLTPVVKKGEKATDPNEVGLIYEQQPKDGTILNKRIHSNNVILYQWVKPDSSDSNTGSITSSENKYMIYIHQFGKGGRIHVGTEATFKTPKKYAKEWLAGNKQTNLKKKEVTKPLFSNAKEAREAACKMISDKKIITIPGQGKVPSGKFEGKRYWIDGLGCKIQEN
jgi:hypothetical protein